MQRKLMDMDGEYEEALEPLITTVNESFMDGLLCLFAPPASHIMEWIDADHSYFSSDEERASFIEYIEEIVADDSSDVDADEEEEPASELDEEEEPASDFDDTVQDFLDKSNIAFVKHVFHPLFPLILSIDGHPPFYKDADETAECRQKRVYGLIHEIVYDFFLSVYTKIDVSATRKAVTQHFSDNDKNDNILWKMMDDNEYGAHAVQLATDATCRTLCDAVLDSSADIQVYMRNKLLICARREGLAV